MSSTPLGAFCTQIINFFEDLQDTYPEEKDIAKATSALKLIKMANPRRLHTAFMEIVTPDFREHIMTEDEEYLIKHAKALLDQEYSDISFAFWIFDKHWSTMTHVNKKHIWNYLKTIVVLGQRVPPA